MLSVYPLRMSRNYWKIPLYCYHECSSLCLIMSSNSCPSKGKLYPTYIDIGTFCMEQPTGLFGRLYYPELEVIPDLEYFIEITFPMTCPTIVRVQKQQSTTLVELIQTIVGIYKSIYRHEEYTSTPTTFTIEQECVCASIDLKTFTSSKRVDSHSFQEDCSICYNPNDEHVIRLDCNHEFHESCIHHWIEKGNGTSCPFCRQRILTCSECNNRGTITSVQEHIVLPPHLRPPFSGRNFTNGEYGIHTYDVEDLRITSMFYNRQQRTLQLNVSGSSSMFSM